MAEKKGKLVEIKTKQNEQSVLEFVQSVDDEQKQKDSMTILEMMQKASGEEPKMWGASLVGFGKKIYKSAATGREVEWLLIGFSPRKANISLHLTMDVNQFASKLEKLGKYKTGVGCLYIKKLSDVDVSVLEEIINLSLK
ncbi:MAG TPA: DUF1801 domain-containing protein [Saprospiraceae bacterium]|nr:DUF1801 domain-containing protein [Saprospiraceae bacterium]